MGKRKNTKKMKKKRWSKETLLLVTFFISNPNKLCPTKYPSMQNKFYCYDGYPQVKCVTLLLTTRREELFV